MESNVPLPVDTYKLPLVSQAGPQPLPQIPPRSAFAVELKIPFVPSVWALNPNNQPWYGLLSQCDPQPKYTTPLFSSSAMRLSCRNALKDTCPEPSVSMPVPRTLP